jgi:N-acetyldiaminopimelate deacetylase
MQVQAMVSRNFDPAAGGVVLTFGTISGGTAQDAVAPSARVAGTLRVLTKAQHDMAFRRIREIAHGVAAAVGASVDVQLNDGAYPPPVDDTAVARKFVDYAVGRKDVKLVEAPVTMTSEDFGYIVDHIPGMMFWLGVGGDNPLHSNRFAPDEDAIGPAVALVGEYLLQV